MEFSQLRTRTTKETLPELVAEFGIVYVPALPRQGCSGCETKKTLYQMLAERITQENPGKVRFRRLLVNYEGGDKRESWSSKRVFGHAAYPTYTIHVKSHVGPLEIYRSVYPPMEELGKQIKDSFELAEFYKTEAQTASRPDPENI